MQSVKKIFSNGLMVLGLSFGLTMSVLASDNFDWYKAQAEQGFAESQYLTGLAYRDGKGVQQDHKKALYWLKKASDQKSSVAQFSLGGMYAFGVGVRQNKTTGKEWFGKSCDNGDQGGCDFYRKLNEQGY